MPRNLPIAPPEAFADFANLAFPLATGGNLIFWAIRTPEPVSVIGFGGRGFDADWAPLAEEFGLALDITRVIAPPSFLALPEAAGVVVAWAQVDEAGTPRLMAQLVLADGRISALATLPGALTADGTLAGEVTAPDGRLLALSAAVDADEAGGNGTVRLTARLGTLDAVSASLPSPPQTTLLPDPTDTGGGGGGGGGGGDPGPVPRGPSWLETPLPEAAGAPVLGSNLLAPADWESSQPFIDLFKGSRAWVTRRDEAWNTGENDRVTFDAQGWVVAKPADIDTVSTILFTGSDALAHPPGRYVVTWEGAGELRISAPNIDLAASGEHRLVFDYAEAGNLLIEIASTDPAGSGDYIRNIRVFEERLEPLLAAGEVFHPVFLERVEDLRVLRFMDWGNTNNNPPGDWATRTEPGDAQYMVGAGIPVEMMVRLANQVAADAWFCIPHLADDAFVRAYATLVRDTLDPALRVYAQFSNEQWNWGFPQSHHGVAQAAADLGFEGGTGWLQWYGMRAAQVAEIWRAVFAETGQQDRLRTVFEAMVLPEPALTAPDYVRLHGIRPPHESFDVFATSGYFGHGFTLAENRPTLEAWLAEPDGGFASAFRQILEGGLLAVEGRTDSLPALAGFWADQARIAHGYGLEMVVYEGGSHIADPFAAAPPPEILSFFQALHRHPRMAEAYTALLENWREVGGTVFVNFTDAGVPSRYGSFGVYETMRDTTSPRAEALAAFQAANSPWWNDPRGAEVFANGSLLTGWRGETVLRGGAGDDRFFPLTPTGASTLIGGAGDDSYWLDSAQDRVVERAGGGVDHVRAGFSLALAAHVEQLSLTGAAALDGLGNGLANLLRGNAGANRLDGRSGADTLIGGAGNDTLVVDDPGDVVQEAEGGGIDLVLASVSATLAEHVEHLSLAGTAANDATGNAAANRLTGNAGANRLDGQAGADTLRGGAGDDTYLVDDPGDRVLEGTDQGADLVLASISFTLGPNLEALTLLGTAGLSANGNAGANLLRGNDGANRLDGRGGADTMIGGAGNDTYVAAEAGDAVVEAPGGGTDLVLAAISLTLAEEVENLTLTGLAGLSGTGNGSANLLRGNAGANLLAGAEGADTLFGGAGADTLTGGAGQDRLLGGAGADVFVFAVAPGEADADRIGDFDPAQDRLLLAHPAFGPPGPIAPGARLGYDAVTGVLSFDADGAGGAPALRLATLAAGLDLSGAEILIG